jgi:4-amino-4-deoxy-L-arabinose transferase-like glycosyltransferase
LLTRRRAHWVLALLCLQFLGLGVVQAWRDAPTFDEQYHLAAGVTALTRHQLRITPEHPPLGEVLAAAPILTARPVIPAGRSWRSGDSDAYARDFMAAQIRAGTLRRVTFLGRLVPLAEGAAIGLLVFVLASELFGPAAGLFAAMTWLTLPLVVGLGHIDGVDIPFTLATLALSLVLLKYIRAPTTRRALLLGLVCGLALAARLNAFVLVPTILAVVVVIGRSSIARAARHVGVVVGTSWAAVWVVYRLLSPFPDFRHVGLPGGRVSFTARVVLLAPWPSEYAYGIRKQALVAAIPAPGYLLGHAWRGARWWFWPGSMLVKLPVTTLVVMLVGLLFWRGIGHRSVWEAAVVLGAPALALTAFILPQPRDLGLRYLLPVIALLIIAGSRLFDSPATRQLVGSRLL